jgi:hypothetical protein
MSVLLLAALGLSIPLQGQTLRPLIELPPTVYGAEATHDSSVPRHALSADGRYLVFSSRADNLDAGGGGTQVYLRDAQSGTVRMLTRGFDGRRGDASSGSPAISADGTHVAFISSAANLVAGDVPNTPEVFVERLADGMRWRFAVPSDSASMLPRTPWAPVPSAEGSRVVFGALRNGFGDAVYVGELATGTVVRITPPEDAGQPVLQVRAFDFAVAGGGIAYAYGTLAAVQEHGVRWQALAGGAPELLSVDGSGQPASVVSFEVRASADGSRVGFLTHAAVLAADDNARQDVYVRDRNAATTALASLLPGGVLGNDHVAGFALAGGGRWAAFRSSATNTPEGTPGTLYLRDLDQAASFRVGRLDPEGLALSHDGVVLAFDSARSDLAAQDRNGRRDVFLRGPLPAGTTSVVSRASSGPYPTVPCCIDALGASSNGAWLAARGARIDPTLDTRFFLLAPGAAPAAVVAPVARLSF